MCKVSLRGKKVLGIFGPGEMIPATRRRTTRVAFWDPPSGSKKLGQLGQFLEHLDAREPWLAASVTAANNNAGTLYNKYILCYNRPIY